MGPQRFILGSICPSTPFERYRRFTSPSKRAVDSQNFWRLLNSDDPVYVYRRAVFPVLCWRSNEREKKLSNRLAGSRFFQSFRRHRHRLSSISQLICQISQLILDRSHVNSSHDVPTCKVIDLRTMDRLCVRGPTGRVDGQRKRRMEGENAFTVSISGSLEQSISFTRERPSSVPCVEVFISGSVCPSSSFPRNCRFASPCEQAGDSKSFWSLSNTDAPMCVHEWTISPALR